MRVTIARACHCILKNEIDQVHECKDIEEARAYALKLLQFLENNNCKAHIFFIRESAKEIVIDSKFNVDDISI